MQKSTETRQQGHEQDHPQKETIEGRRKVALELEVPEERIAPYNNRCEAMLGAQADPAGQSNACGHGRDNVCG